MKIEITKRQEDILSELYAGGKIYWCIHNSKPRYDLVDKGGNETYIEKVTVRKLLYFGFVTENVDRPCLGTNTIMINEAGRLMVESKQVLTTNTDNQ